MDRPFSLPPRGCAAPAAALDLTITDNPLLDCYYDFYYYPLRTP